MDFFTNKYDLSITTHLDLEDKKRPVYEFRAATIKERREETETAKYLDRLADPKAADDVDDPIEYIEAVLPHIEKRLLRVKVGKKAVKSLMNLEETLDYTSIVELFWSMRNNEEIGVLVKKKLALPSNSNTAESVKDATTNATGPQEKKAK